ncbi:MAG: DNA/RNA non-specific endonuclease [Bacteroidales bacterium]|nr:DNA/RNA non-specific endonuclease [Bacteroidales bacterium]
MTERIFRFTLCLAVLSGIAVSCGKSGEDEPYVTDAGITPRKTAFSSDKGSTFVSVNCNGDWTLSLSYPADGESGWASIEPESGSGSRGDVRLIYEANESETTRSVVITLQPKNGLAASVTIVQLGEGVTYVPDDPLPSENGQYGADVASAGWLELPATVAGDGREFFTHDMKGGRYVSQAVSGIRNWSFYYDYDAYDALWVAYPLNNGLRASGSRTNAWGIDPLIPMAYQSASYLGGYGSGYDRGHQLPSNDRLSYSANVTTFYPTNMTPQYSSFNQGIWEKLEEKVRSYASSSDTLYVVTGCVLAGSPGTITDRAGNKVTVPAAYFKALLRYMPSSTYGFGGYMAAGYYLPHSTSISGNSFTGYIMSIDELEQKTGIDFFVNLASVVGKDTADKIEAQSPINWWTN